MLHLTSKLQRNPVSVQHKTWPLLRARPKAERVFTEYDNFLSLNDPTAYSRTLLHEWYQASPAADASQSETRLLLWRHCWLNNTGLAIQCDMNSLTSVLNFESKNKMRRRSVEMFQVAIAACLSWHVFRSDKKRIRLSQTWKLPRVGLEPTIFRKVGRLATYCATSSQRMSC